jgi:UDP-N-acetylmuramyl pentapeptide synthase
MVVNATLALAAVYATDADLLEAAAANLARAEMTAGRLQIRREAGLQILDDSYNANPDSMVAALATLTGMRRTQAERGSQGKAIAILGGMGELGDFAREGYERVGREAGELGVDVLLAVNVDDPVLVKSAGDAGVNLVEACPDHQTAAARLTEIAGSQDLILLKGSRAAAMEKILDHLA